MLLLYLGDWMICLKSTEWWMMNISEKAYMPYQIPCLPTAGVAYLAAIVVSFRFVRRPPFGLLLILILAVSIPATVINVRESWNEFGWGSMTVFAAIGLAAAISSPLLRSRIIRALGIVYYAWLLVAIGLFLAGPKWGYSSPCWEKAFIGRMKWYLLPESTSAARSEEARRLVVRTADRHPDNPLVLFYLLQLTDDPVRRYEARDRLREVDPDNPYFGVFEAKVLLYQDKAERVRDRLKELIQRHPPYADFHQYLAAAELALGHYEAAISQARTTLALKPDAYGMHRFLGRAHAANDEPVAAWQSYQRYVAAHFEQPAEGYAEVARQALNERHGMVAIRALDALRVEASVDTMAGLWARINLAWLFSTHPDPNLRNGQRAVELAEEAMARPGEYTVGTESPRDETSFRIISLDTLAAAYAEQGRFTQAIESAEAALSLAESNRRVGAKLRLRDRLDRYRDELPWRLRLSDSLARLEGY
jgi:tetratricopeptide (TPR) repeat protein